MPRRYYQGRFSPKNLHKYKGNAAKIQYRSSWEGLAFQYLDMEPSVVQWSSEKHIVPYHDITTRKNRKYYIDLWIKYSDGRQLLVEIKPRKQCLQPIRGKTPLPRYIKECITYQVNISKWTAADIYAQKRGIKFVVWCETDLRRMGILK